MTVANTLKLKFSVNGELTEGTATDIQDLAGHGRLEDNLTFSQGSSTTAFGIDRQVFGSATMGAAGGGSATVGIDLNGGGLTTPAKETANFAKVRLITVVLASGTGPIRAGGANNTFNFGMGAATNTFTFQSLPFVAGRDDSVALTVTAGSGDIFALENLGADTATVKYTIAGTA